MVRVLGSVAGEMVAVLTEPTFSVGAGIWVLLGVLPRMVARNRPELVPGDPLWSGMRQVRVWRSDDMVEPGAQSAGAMVGHWAMGLPLAMLGSVSVMLAPWVVPSCEMET